MTFSNVKRGGIRFIRVGRLSLTMSVARKAPRPASVVDRVRAAILAREASRLNHGAVASVILCAAIWTAILA